MKYLPVPCFSEYVEIERWPKTTRAEYDWLAHTKYAKYKVIEGKRRIMSLTPVVDTISIWSNEAREKTHEIICKPIRN